MTDNEKLQMWQLGAVFNNIPDYLNDDSAAMSLLDTLVEKGYAVDMASRGHKWDIGIARNDCNLDYCISMVKPTRRESIVAAVLELIGKEDV